MARIENAHERRFEEELAKEVELRRGLDIGAWCVALFSLATLLLLVMGMGRTSPWLLGLSFYIILTRASSFVLMKAFLYPRFLLELDSSDAEVAAGARAVLERHRSRIVRPVLRDLLRSSDAAAVAALGAEELATLARDYGIEERRRFGRRWFYAWCLLTVLVWSTLLLTGGGPAGLTGKP